METFLSGLMKQAPRDGLLEVRITPMERGNGLLARRFLPLTNVEWLSEAIEAQKQIPSMIAFGVNPRRRAGGSDSDVSCIVGVTADLDGKKNSINDQVEKIGKIVKKVAPYAIVKSGSSNHGHVYFRLKEPTAEIEKARFVGKRLRQWLGTDPSEQPSKMMRLPGSWNWKAGVPVKVEAGVNDSAWTTLDALNSVLESVGAPEPTVKSNGSGSGSGSGSNSDEPNRQRLLNLWSALPEWARKKAQEVLPDEMGLRHPRDYAVASAFAQLGATDDEILWFFEAFHDGLGAKLADESYGYFKRTMDLVRLHVEYTSELYVADVQTTYCRVVLKLIEMSSGTLITQGVESNGSAWPWLFRSAGLQPGDNPACAAWLKGRTVKAVLGDSGVKRFVPAI